MCASVMVFFYVPRFRDVYRSKNVMAFAVSVFMLACVPMLRDCCVLFGARTHIFLNLINIGSLHERHSHDIVQV